MRSGGELKKLLAKQLIEKYRQKERALTQARAKAAVATGAEGPDLSKAIVYALMGL